LVDGSSKGGLTMRVSSWLRTLTDPLALVELFVVANIAFLAVDIFVAHSVNVFAHWAEWIPLVFSLVAPAVLVAAMVLAGNVRPPAPATCGRLSAGQRLARFLGMFVGAASVVVGVAGLLWHLESQFFEQQTLRSLVYTAPFAAPLSYSGLGFLILLDRMVPAESDAWARWVVLLALGGWIGNFALSLADHAQNAFFNWAEWIPVVASALAIGFLSVAAAAAAVAHRSRLYLRLCIGLMGLEIVVALVGWGLHLRAVAASPMAALWDRVVYSAPLFAPLLFADLALLAMIGLATLDMRAKATIHKVKC
jgi:hypothetical protein